MDKSPEQSPEFGEHGGWPENTIPVIPIRGGFTRWPNETDRDYFNRIRESVRQFERERCAKIASDFTMKPDRSIHPYIPWDQMNEVAKIAAHTTAQQIAAKIRSGE